MNQFRNLFALVVMLSLGYSVIAQNAANAQQGNSRPGSALEASPTAPASPQQVAAPSADANKSALRKGQPVYKDTGNPRQDADTYRSALKKWLADNPAPQGAEGADQAAPSPYSPDNVVYPDSVDTSGFTPAQRNSPEYQKSPKDFIGKEGK